MTTPRRVLVTGGGTGIGLAVAKIFAADGDEIVITGRRDEVLKSAVADIGGNVIAVCGDVSHARGAQDIVEAAVAKLGYIDVIVNSAGIVRRGLRLHEYDEQTWDEIIAINFLGTANICRYALRHMLNGRGDRSVINIASTHVDRGARSLSAYAAAKAGVVGLTKSLALDYGGDGIRFNCLILGSIETDMTHAGRDFNAIRDQVTSLYPLGRLGAPEDAARAAMFLSREPWITGACLAVDGGLLVS